MEWNGVGDHKLTKAGICSKVGSVRYALNWRMRNGNNVHPSPKSLLDPFTFYEPDVRDLLPGNQ